MAVHVQSRTAQPVFERAYARSKTGWLPSICFTTLYFELSLIMGGITPLRFVGSGVLADRLQSQPATFNVPTRRELEKALKFSKHILDVAGGKGGHQKWTGPDQRAFILPTRDPVSVGVFKTFLQHLGIDKATYVREVRPNL